MSWYGQPCHAGSECLSNPFSRPCIPVRDMDHPPRLSTSLRQLCRKIHIPGTFPAGSYILPICLAA
jgi:hypothetical protein